MIKSELNEIKKQFKLSKDSSLDRICGCYVDGEKNIKTTFNESFLNLPEAEANKYFTIFRKSLSGAIGRNALNMEFPLEAESEDGTQEFLLRLRNSKLKDEALLEQFYTMVINCFDYVGNYLILLIHDTYDVPNMTTDNIINEDASDTVFDYIVCAVCPVNLSKPGLSYDASANEFHDRIRDWVVELPEVGFLFPAFNDRATDIHSLMYYVKDTEELYDVFLDGVLGCVPTHTAKTQKALFQTLIEETLGDDITFDVVQSIHENLTELEEEHKNLEIAEPLTIDKRETKMLFEKSGVSNDKLQTFEKVFDASVGENNELFAVNVHAQKKYEVKTPDIIIKVNPERSDLITTKEIDGRKCIVIEINDSVELNGIEVRI